MSAPKSQILSLYKQLLRESQKFPTYNFRTYALRRLRDAFKENRDLSDIYVIDAKLEYAKKNLEIIKRQALIGQMFSSEKLVIEHKATEQYTN